MKDGLRVVAGLAMAVAMPLVVHPSAGASPAGRTAGCAATAEAAVELYRMGAVGGDEGFRVVAVRKDALRAKTWAMVERCNRPEVPLRSLLVAASERPVGSLPVVALDVPARAGAVVHAGEAVTVRGNGSGSRMELHGWADEGGAVSAKIRVRLPRISEGEDGPAPRIVCTVVAAGQVEVAQ